MLSNGSPILMRVRVSFDALRLCLLVAAGVTSGYLWRAAFEESSPVEQRVAATPRIVHPAPAPPTVRIVPHHLTVPAKRSATHHVVVHSTPPPSTSLVSQPVALPVLPGTSPPSKPTPKPTPAPSPPPTTTTTPPPQAPTPTTPVSTPVTQTVSAPPTTTTPATATTPPPETQPPDETRPGWGNGDKNHDHSGPGGGKSK